MRVTEIARLLRDHEPTENDMRSVNYTLQLLRVAGYVHRLSYIDPEEERGLARYVYGLTDEGVAYVINQLPFLRLSAKPFDDHSARTLDHELEISFFHIALRMFCHNHGLQLYWQQKDLKKTVAPDAYFSITDPKQPQGKNTLHYFLEIERAKIGNVKNGEPSIIRKLAKYYDYFDTDVCQKEWQHFRKFRVIVVQRSEAKRQFLLETLKENYAHRMFWLTTEELYKKDIGGEIFATPKDSSQRSYSFLNLNGST